MSADFWTPRKVAWYERALERSDYAERVFAAIAPLLVDCRTAIDAGAGCGALALPLARRLDHVTAVEPSAAMAAALRAAAARERLANITVVERAWGEVPVDPHDLVLCALVAPLLRPGAPFLADANRLARRGAALVRDAPGGDDKFFFSELYPRLLGRPYGKAREHDDTLDALKELGVAPIFTTVEYASDQPFDTLDEACDFWMAYMGLDDRRSRDVLAEFLATRLERDGAGWVARYRKRASIVWWRTD